MHMVCCIIVSLLYVRTVINYHRSAAWQRAPLDLFTIMAQAIVLEDALIAA